ncbi:hypothetical protein sm9_1499 [Methanobrevibacter millerae]|uniref:Uncharacterized protein n=1 Tax=Methanobrevibacter millerae TaxID=230361 RepID=A0A0U3CUF0_9EURY|nr:hypothetical protein sm9_1499 [Methanobrevibacter millerae]
MLTPPTSHIGSLINFNNGLFSFDIFINFDFIYNFIWTYYQDFSSTVNF